MNELQTILQTYDRGQANKKQMAIATVVNTQGSVYRRAGARMLLLEDGEMVGAISGGCLEGDIFEKSQMLWFEDWQGKPPAIVARYDTTAAEEILWGLGLGCQGVVEVLIEPLTSPAAAQSLAFIQTSYAQQKRGAIATVFQVNNASTDFPIHLGDRIFLNDIIQATNADLISLVQSDLHQTRSLGKSQIKTYQVDQAELKVLLEVIHPPISLLIFGAGHDAIPLVEQAKWLGWTVTLCDHRPGYTNRDRFP
ncbi:MAG: XdhC family protein, partial [Synechococcales bacterium]|nr:XdhC family protein [Synechococcales bacterium]